MKKWSVLFLAGILIFAFGTSGFAQAPKLEFRASGMLDTQTFYGVNVPQYGGQMNNPQTNASFWGSNTTALFLNTAYGGLPNYYSLGNFPPPGSPIGTSWTGAGYVLPAGLAGGVATGSMGYPNLYGQSNPNFALALGAPAQVVDRIGNAGAGRATWAPNFTPAAPFGRTDSTASVSNGFDKVNSHWNARAHLKFDAIMGPNLSGTIFFEIDTYRWGAQGYSGFPGLGREANNFGTWTTDRTAVEVKNIYIDVGLPYFGIPVPITLRVGAQPIGVRPAMLVYSDGTGVTAGIKIDPVVIAPIYAKMLEGNDFQDDDMDVWGLHANAKISTFTVGGYGLYYRMNSYPIWVTVNALAAPLTALNPVVAGTDKSHIFWWGAYADGKLGPVNINADWVMDSGWVKQGNTAVAGPLGPYVPASAGGTAPIYGIADSAKGAFNPFLFFKQPLPVSNVPGTTAVPMYGWMPVRHVNYQGWAARLKVEYPWEKFSVGATGMYATGSNSKSTSAEGLPGQYTSINTYPRRVSGYVVPPGSEQATGNGESMVVYSMESASTGGYGLATRSNYAAVGPGGFGGTWFAKLFGSVKLTPWYKITLQGLYIGDTTGHGNTLGNAFRFPGQDVVALQYQGINNLRNDKRIGVELDLLQEFQIYNNLRFFIGFGYLFAGDATDVGHLAVVGNRTVPTLDGVPVAPVGVAGPIIGINRSIANPWAVRTRLQYTF